MARLSKTRKRMRGHSRSRTRQQGGRKIGQGQYGIVYSPPLNCANGSDAPYKSTNYVGKQVHLMNRSVLERQRNLLLNYNKNQQITVPPLRICNLAPVQTNANFAGFVYENTNSVVPSATHERRQQVIYKFAGRSLYSILDSFANKDYTTLSPEKQKEEYEKDRAEIQSVFRALKEFLPELQKFNRRFIHNDLHPDNIVFDGIRFRMIDFDLFLVREESLKKVLNPPPVNVSTLSGARLKAYLRNSKAPTLPIEDKVRKFDIQMDAKDPSKLFTYTSEDLNKPIFKELFPDLESWLESKDAFKVSVPELGITYTDAYAAFADLFARIGVV